MPHALKPRLRRRGKPFLWGALGAAAVALAFTAADRPASAQGPVVVGGQGLPAVEVNLEVLQNLGSAAPLRRLRMPGQRLAEPEVIRLKPPPGVEAREVVVRVPSARPQLPESVRRARATRSEEAKGERGPPIPRIAPASPARRVEGRPVPPPPPSAEEPKRQTARVEERRRPPPPPSSIVEAPSRATPPPPPPPPPPPRALEKPSPAPLARVEPEPPPTRETLPLVKREERGSVRAALPPPKRTVDPAAPQPVPPRAAVSEPVRPRQKPQEPQEPQEPRSAPPPASSPQALTRSAAPVAPADANRSVDEGRLPPTENVATAEPSRRVPSVAPPPRPRQEETAALPPRPPAVIEREALRVLFSGSSSRLTEEGEDDLQALVESIAETEARIQLKAFAGGSADRPSTARRLSLSRALAVRSFLIEQGLRSTRIDVRALGVPADEGPADRVDVILLTQ